MPVDVKEVKRRLCLLLKDENLVAEYIRRFGPTIDMKNIKLVKESEVLGDARGEETDPSKGADPIFELTLSCPVCNNENVRSYELKAKSQQLVENKLLQQEYIGAMGHRTVDYDFLSVAICPRCLFASPDRKDMVGKNKITGKAIPSQIPPNVILTLQEKIGERKALLEGVANLDDFFKRPRKSEAAILSYKLAALRAKIEAFYEMPNALYKLGFYYLKIAKIMKKRREDDTPALKEALDYLLECFKNSNASGESAEYRVIYCIVALHIRLGDSKKGHPYIGVLDKIRGELNIKAKSDPKINLAVIDSWLTKVKNLWEDREREGLFN